MNSAPGLRRRLGLPLLTLYGIGVMVGAGIYVLIGVVAGMAGLYAPFAFLLAAIVAAPTAAAYAELSARIPEAGGEAAFLRDAFRIPFLPQVAAVMIIGGATLSAAAVLQGGAGYLQAILPLSGWILIPALALLLTGAAILGVVESLALAAALTVIEVGGLVFVSAAGFAAPPSPEWSAGLAAPGALPIGAAGLAAASLLAFFAFIGFEDMVNMAEETIDPGRTMPKAILIALAVTGLLYALTAAAALHAASPEALAVSSRPLAMVAEAGAPGSAGWLAGVALAAAINGVLAQIVMGARMLYGASRDLPRLAWLNAVHPRFGTPVTASLVVGALVCAVALSVPLLSLAAASAGILLAVFVVVNAALIVLRRRGPAPEGAWRAPAVTPWLGASLSAAALAASTLGWLA